MLGSTTGASGFDMWDRFLDRASIEGVVEMEAGEGALKVNGEGALKVGGALAGASMDAVRVCRNGSVVCSSSNGGQDTSTSPVSSPLPLPP
jgi:hypothetical protein